MFFYDHIWSTYGDDMVINGIIIVNDSLVGGLEHEWIMTSHSVGNFMIPTGELIFFRVQTTNQQMLLRLSNPWIQMAETCLYQTTIWLFNIAMENHNV